MNRSFPLIYPGLLPARSAFSLHLVYYAFPLKFRGALGNTIAENQHYFLIDTLFPYSIISLSPKISIATKRYRREGATFAPYFEFVWAFLRDAPLCEVIE